MPGFCCITKIATEVVATFVALLELLELASGGVLDVRKIWRIFVAIQYFDVLKNQLELIFGLRVFKRLSVELAALANRIPKFV